MNNSTSCSTRNDVMVFRLSCFVLENLARQEVIDWVDGYEAHRRISEGLDIISRELPWLATQGDQQGHRSFGGCMLTDGRLGFVFLTGEAVTLDLPQRWSPVPRGGLANPGYKALLTGPAKAFRSSHESARAVSCS